MWQCVIKFVVCFLSLPFRGDLGDNRGKGGLFNIIYLYIMLNRGDIIYIRYDIEFV